MSFTVEHADGSYEDLDEITFDYLDNIQLGQGGILGYFGTAFNYRDSIDMYGSHYPYEKALAKFEFDGHEIILRKRVADCCAILVDGFGKIVSPYVIWQYYVENYDAHHAKKWRGITYKRHWRQAYGCGFGVRTLTSRYDLADSESVRREYGERAGLRAKQRSIQKYTYGVYNQYDDWYTNKPKCWKDQSKAKRQWI